MKTLLQVGETCPNPDCPQHGPHCPEKMIRFGHSKAGRQRYKCQVCDKTFTATTGTRFYRRRTSPDEIVTAIGQLAEGARVSSVARTTGHKEETISGWLVAASSQAQLLDEGVVADYHISEGQLDGLWSYGGQKGGKKDYAETDKSGQFFRSTMMLDVPTRLRVAHGIGKTETEASIEVFQILQQRGHPEAPPACVSDGWGGIREAVVEVYGKVPEDGGQSRPPTRKRPQSGWQYLQVSKHRDATGHVTGRTVKVIFGDEAEVLEQLGHHTAYVERTHLTMRPFSGRLVRKGLGFSQDLEMPKASAVLEDVDYNLVRPYKSLRQKRQDETVRRWIPRTPAMAAKLTDHVWTLKEVFSIIGVANNS